MVAAFVQRRGRRGAGRRTPGCSSPTTSSRARPTRTRCPPRRRAGRSGLPSGQCRLPLGAAARRARRAGPARDREPRARRARRGRCRSGRRVACLIRYASASWAGSERSAGTVPCIEVDGRIVVLDCGIMFPEPDMPGHRPRAPGPVVPPRRADAVEAVVLTHGHEDHTGGLAYPASGTCRSPSTAPRSPSGWPATGSKRRASPTGPASSR